MSGVKLAVKKNLYVFILLILVLTSRSTQWGSLLRWGKAVVGLRQSIRAKKHFRYASFFGCLRVIVVDLGALEDKFVANSVPKTAEKTQLLWKWMPVQTVLLLPFFLDDPVCSSSWWPSYYPIFLEMHVKQDSCGYFHISSFNGRVALSSPEICHNMENMGENEAFCVKWGPNEDSSRLVLMRNKSSIEDLFATTG